jgi:hypothetical protein
MTLSPGDLGDGFTLVAEDNTRPADQNVRDVNHRVFQSDDMYVQLSMLVGRVSSADQPTEMVTNLAAEMRKVLAGDVSWGTPHDFVVGERGSIQEFTVGSAPDQRRGYIAVFIKTNVIVVLTEIGPAWAMTEEAVEMHARTIESRMR